ncbi:MULTISPECIES: hypothetical protein [Selenomonas]|uniref:Uncharacterized protein n=1 Tax=Selenomonas ruminis TaxID=2593411 RepID=A0A5D6WEE2_9FIRM|nr:MULTISPECIES: hypothetical protein [unclassified Selenomonas]MBQ1867763.1 hypothetical protein [Selenomonas sp.]TYZ24814.1 hypothetical protein FZ040_01885 [Selenomonas sp. mPRGC5]
MEQIERIKKITNAWEPELCRYPVNREAKVNMDIYHEGAIEPERHKISMARAIDYISSMAAVMDIKAMLRDLDHITIRSAEDDRLIYRVTARYGYAEEEFVPSAV